jgi:hypothetical protein
MGEFVVRLPKDLEREAKEVPELEGEVREFIKLKLFENELRKSAELQRIVFESLAKKSVLTEKDASYLGKKVSSGMLKEHI